MRRVGENWPGWWVQGDDGLRGAQEQKWALMKGQYVINAGAADERKELSSDWAECYLTTTEQREEGWPLDKWSADTWLEEARG